MEEWRIYICACIHSFFIYFSTTTFSTKMYSYITVVEKVQVVLLISYNNLYHVQQNNIPIISLSLDSSFIAFHLFSLHPCDQEPLSVSGPQRDAINHHQGDSVEGAEWDAQALKEHQVPHLETLPVRSASLTDAHFKLPFSFFSSRSLFLENFVYDCFLLIFVLLEYNVMLVSGI